MVTTKHLLIVYHSQSGKTAQLAEAVLKGAEDPQIAGVTCSLIKAAHAGPPALFAADAVIFGTPENFGYMSGAMKDFFDRSFYPCEGRLEGMPYALFVGAGNDGRGAVLAVQKIARGLALKEVQQPLVVNTDLTPEIIGACENLGTTLAAGLELGVY